MLEFLHSAASPSGDTNCEGKHPTVYDMTCNLAQSWRYCSMVALFFFFPRDLLHRQYIYSVYKDTLKKNVPVTNLNKYLQYGTSVTE